MKFKYDPLATLAQYLCGAWWSAHSVTITDGDHYATAVADNRPGGFDFWLTHEEAVAMLS